jgi:hypothetical protein
MRLKAEAKLWEMTVRAAREKFYYLNFFTMREILVLIRNVLGKAQRLQVYASPQCNPNPPIL